MTINDYSARREALHEREIASVKSENSDEFWRVHSELNSLEDEFRSVQEIKEPSYVGNIIRKIGKVALGVGAFAGLAITGAAKDMAGSSLNDEQIKYYHTPAPREVQFFTNPLIIDSLTCEDTFQFYEYTLVSGQYLSFPNLTLEGNLTETTIKKAYIHRECDIDISLNPEFKENLSLPIFDVSDYRFWLYEDEKLTKVIASGNFNASEEDYLETWWSNNLYLEDYGYNISDSNLHEVGLKSSLEKQLEELISKTGPYDYSFTPGETIRIVAHNPKLYDYPTIPGSRIWNSSDSNPIYLKIPSDFSREEVEIEDRTDSKDPGIKKGEGIEQRVAASLSGLAVAAGVGIIAFSNREYKTDDSLDERSPLPKLRSSLIDTFDEEE